MPNRLELLARLDTYVPWPDVLVASTNVIDSWFRVFSRIACTSKAPIEGP
ncbi:hypothetical protein RSAG8_08011, partial [Rhizoctonia solani AG-8 WAC10335]